MTDALKKAWTEMVRPILQRPKRVQMAALCYRRREDGTKEVLLITSLDSGRWILPKGWPMDGMDGPGTALQEAWEEAGVKAAEIEDQPVGCYEYVKAMDHGGEATVQTRVYPARVGELADAYPDAETRKRRWVTPDEAAEMVAEPGLREIFRQM